MKLRRELVGKHALLCPSCRAPIAIDFAGDGPADGPVEPLAAAPGSHLPPSRMPQFQTPGSTLGPPPRPAPAGPSVPSEQTKLPAARQPVTFTDANSTDRRVLPPADSKLGANFVGKLQQIEVEPTVRQKKRRRREAGEIHLADWDTLTFTEIPEAELRADEWTQPGPDLLQAEQMVPKILRATAEPVDVYATDEGLMVERKRVRKGRRRTLAIVRVFQGLTAGARWGLLALLLGVAGACTWFFRASLHEKASVSGSEPSPTKLNLAGSTADPVAQVSTEDTEGSFAIVRQFLLAQDWRAKSAFVRRQDKVKPLMEKWYVTHPDGSLACEEPDDIKKSLVGNSYFVFLAVRMGPEKVLRYFTVEHIPPRAPNMRSQYLVDWETSVGYQPMELRDFMTKQPQDPLTFRVLCKPEHYYNYGFENAEAWMSFELSYPGDLDFVLHGYVPKESPLADELQRQMMLEANIMLQIRYPADPISREQVIIDKIAHPSWFYDREDVVPLRGNHNGKVALDP